MPTGSGTCEANHNLLTKSEIIICLPMLASTEKSVNDLTRSASVAVYESKQTGTMTDTPYFKQKDFNSLVSTPKIQGLTSCHRIGCITFEQCCNLTSFST